MIISSISTLALGEIPDDLSQAEANPFQILLNNQDAQLIYLIEFEPYNENKQNTISGLPPIGAGAIGEFDFYYEGGIDNVYISDTGYITKPSESPANISYLPLTDNPLQFDVSIFNGDEFRGGLPSAGAIKVLNGDGSLDDLTNYYWGGRSVRVYAGSREFRRNQFSKIFDGLCRDVEASEDELIINLSDKSVLLETEFEQNLYDGTGDLEGGDDIANTPKPLAFGECKNVAPILVDAANLIYQVHDGSLQSIDAVYDKGVELTNAGNVSDITSTSVSAGYYKTQLNGGYIKLGGTPSGQITVDLKGDNSDTYITHPVDIADYLIRNKLGENSFDDTNIDAGALNSLKSEITLSTGLYISKRTSLKAMLDELLVPVHMYWTFTRQGMFTAGLFSPPSDPVLTIDSNDIDEEGFELLKIIDPAWRITVGYSKAWTVQKESDLATAATTDFRTFNSEEYRVVISENRQIRGKTLSAREVTFNTLLDNQADALEFLDRLEELYNYKRRVFKIKVLSPLFQVYLGQTVFLQMDRYGLDAGQNFLIVNISIDAETATTELELYG